MTGEGLPLALGVLRARDANHLVGGGESRTAKSIPQRYHIPTDPQLRSTAPKSQASSGCFCGTACFSAAGEDAPPLLSGEPGSHFPQLVSAAGSWEAVLVCLLAVLSPGTGAPAGQGRAVLPVEAPLRDSFPSSPDIGSLLSEGLNMEN